MTANPMEVFRKRVPEVTAAFNDLVPLLIASKGIKPEDHP